MRKIDDDSGAALDHNKAMDALWRQCLVECQGLAAACGVSEHVAILARRSFLNEVANNPLDVFEGVAVPASLAGKYAIAVRLRGPFKRRLALTASEYQGHGELSL
jgi:hypothetical protein